LKSTESLRRPPEIRDVFPMLLQIFEWLRGIVERRLGKLWQGVPEILRELCIEPVADARIADDAQQM
jgi:porphobilinogen deaminase